MRVNEVYEGDCIEVMRGFPDNCIDTVLTDPPYDLTGKSGSGGFMGKKWDASGIAFNPEVWRECLRIAKPGATLMAFGGSRTHHRLTCAIEDAGWEIRDCISYFHDGTQAERAFMASLDEEQLGAYLELHRPSPTLLWCYGSGFPKSLSVSAAIDKAKGAEREVVGENIRLGDKKSYSRNQDKDNQNDYVLGNSNGPYEGMGTITAPATPLAREFDGYGTALKPAVEFIVVAMKPMGQDYAANAEEWGVAGLNIDGARVGTEDNLNGGTYSGNTAKKLGDVYGEFAKLKPDDFVQPKGRWPANLIWDGSEEVKKEFDKAGVRSSGGGIKKPANQNNFDWSLQDGRKKKPKSPVEIKGIGDDSGSASRYFAQCPPDPTAHPEAAHCSLCGSPCTQKHSIMNENHTDCTGEIVLCDNVNIAKENLNPQTKKGVFAPKPAQDNGQREKEDRLKELITLAHNAEKLLENMYQIKKSTVLKSAIQERVAQFAQNAKCAGNLCDLCAMNTVHDLVVIKAEKDPESPRTLDCITDSKKLTLLHNLVSFAEKWDNVDTIPTIASLKKLFGSVIPVITDFTSKEFRNLNGKSDPARFSYHSKASRKERGEYNNHPCVKPLSLMRHLSKLTRPPTGGIVLDPFGGSGTTALAAIAEGRDYIIIEKEPEYAELCRRRIAEYTGQEIAPIEHKVNEAETAKQMSLW
jgi:site-specific DNA-methyltransferase (adenine-specific)